MKKLSMKNYLWVLLTSAVLLSACNNSSNESEGSTKSESESESESTDSLSTSDLENALRNARPEPATDISEEELDIFANIYYKIQLLGDSSQFKMAGAIEDAGMNLDRFNEIAQSQDSGSQPDLSDTEKEQLNSISEEFQQIQIKQQEDAMKVLEESGLELARYQSILMAVQEDEALQEKLISKLEKKIETH